MSLVSNWPDPAAQAGVGPDSRSSPPELLELLERVRSMPDAVRRELEPMVVDALEEARFRGGVMEVAREALIRLRLDLALTRFDLDATRREREDLRSRMSSW
jgi:hypothetical protein